MVDRTRLVAVQTPQAFRAAALRARPRRRGQRPPTTLRWSRPAGGTVVLVDGDPTNLKITDPGDLRTAAGPLGGLAGHAGSGRASTSTRSPTAPTTPGRSSSAASTFDGETPAWSATATPTSWPTPVADALLGAAGLGDIGQHFPDTDPAWAGADSVDLLPRWPRRVAGGGLAAGQRRLHRGRRAAQAGARRAEMQERLTDAVGAPVTVKGNRAEGLGALGRAEGIACFAVALVERSAAAS